MKTWRVAVRIGCAGALLSFGAACAGTALGQAGAKASTASAPSATGGAGSSLSHGASSESSELPRIDELDRQLLCGATAESSDTGSIEQLRRELQGLEEDLEKKRASTAGAPPPECKAQVDSLGAIFDQLSGASQTLCDRQVAHGVGIGGAALMDQTEALIGSINAERDAIEKGTDNDCVARRGLLSMQLTEWRGQRDRSCRATDEQNAIMMCGTRGSEASSRAAAERVCSALAANGEVKSEDLQRVESCVQSRLSHRTPPAARAPAPAGAGDRAIGPSALQTTLLGGAADFFAERAQQEVTLFAYDIVKDRLCETDEVKPFLTNTCQLFGAAETLAPTPATIREAARADLDALPPVLVRLVKEKSPALACPTALGWSFGEVATDGADVLELLGSPDLILDNPLVELGCSKPVIADLQKIAAELARLLEDRARVEREVKVGDLERAVMGDRTRALGGGLNQYGKVLKEVMARVKQLDRASVAWERDPTDAHRAAVVVAGLRTIQPIVRFAVERDPTLDATTRARVTESTRLSIELMGQLQNHEYAAVVVTGAQIASAAELRTGKVRNLLGLAASLADAESSDDVRTTLEEAALPVGSWRRKNERRWGATLTGMVGVQLALERVIEDAPREPTATGAAPRVGSGPSLGPSLLIGADLHQGLGKGLRWGIQFTALDLGALLSVRLDDPKVERGAADQTVKDTPELSVEQVFSPGIYPYLGAGPFDIAAGLSFVPALRSVDTGAETSGLNVLRVGLFLAVDVSVLPLL